MFRQMKTVASIVEGRDPLEEVVDKRKEAFDFPSQCFGGGGSPQVQQRELSNEEKALNQAQADAVQKQTEILQQQFELDQALVPEFQEFRKQQLSANKVQLDYLKSQASAAAARQKSEEDFRQQSLDFAKKQQQRIDDFFNKPKSEAQLLLDEITKTQGEQTLKALRGELPISPQTIQQEENAFRVLKESVARSGGNIKGDSLFNAVVTGSSSGQKRLGLLRAEADVRRENERRGLINQGQNMFLAGSNTLSSQNQLGLQNLGATSGYTPYAPAIAQVGYSPSSTLGGYGQLAQTAALAAQPLAAYRTQGDSIALRNATAKGNQSNIGAGLAGAVALGALGGLTGGTSFAFAPALAGAGTGFSIGSQL